MKALGPESLNKTDEGAAKLKKTTASLHYVKLIYFPYSTITFLCMHLNS